jgi:uncharacterized hydrophobic protein (TIGR00271 family)
VAVADPPFDTGSDETTVDPATDPARPLPRRAWWHRHLDGEDRRRVMSDLAIIRIDKWAYRFVVMLTLSVIVAVMGLALNSAAVVIGAMLLAPLMQPVLAAGACLSLALFTKSLIALWKVALATAWCIAIAWAISFVLPEAEVTSEVLARTQPDIKDLVVALAAGAAGAYATVRADVSASLPGVAVAVALVPPLATVGIALEHGETQLAVGALLLYGTNLAAIVFASIAVFVFTGFVTPRRLVDHRIRLTMATLATVAIVVAIAVPLYRASISAIERNDEQDRAEAIVDAWLGDRAGFLDSTISIDREAKQVSVVVRGPGEPPDRATLLPEMYQAFPDYDVPVQFIQTLLATTTTVPPPEPTEQLLADIRVEVEAWLDAGGNPYQIDGLLLDGSLVRIDAAGIGDPPSVDALLPRLQAIDPTLSPGLNWATLATITETTVPSAEEILGGEIRDVVERWAAQWSQIVRSVEYDGRQVVVEVAGQAEPDITELEGELRRTVGSSDVAVTVFFTPRQLVTTTTAPPPTTVLE